MTAIGVPREVVLIGGPLDGEQVTTEIGDVDFAGWVEPGVMGCGTYRRASDHRARWIGWWHTWRVA